MNGMEKDRVTINGEEYVKASALWKETGGHVIVIAERGWIFEGFVPNESPFEEDIPPYKITDGLTLAEAHVVRSWSNGLGIGGLRTIEHKGDYTLDGVGQVWIPAGAIIATIPITEW